MGSRQHLILFHSSNSCRSLSPVLGLSSQLRKWRENTCYALNMPTPEDPVLGLSLYFVTSCSIHTTNQIECYMQESYINIIHLRGFRESVNVWMYILAPPGTTRVFRGSGKGPLFYYQQDGLADSLLSALPEKWCICTERMLSWGTSDSVENHLLYFFYIC